MVQEGTVKTKVEHNYYFVSTKRYVLLCIGVINRERNNYII